MATLEVTIPTTKGVLVGFPLLKELIMNHASIGKVPFRTAREISSDYNVDVSDLMAGAIGMDASESRMLELKVLERVAYKMGKRDGARLIADRKGLSSGMDLDDFSMVDDVARSVRNEPVAYASVVDSYVRGLRAAAARLYVARNKPFEKRLQEMEARVVIAARDSVGAEQLVRMTGDELERAEGGDLEQYVTALSAHSVAKEAANSVAEKVFVDRVVEILAAAPNMTPTEAVQRARMEFRKVVDGELVQRANRRVAWTAVSMQAIQDGLRTWRNEAVAPETPSAKPRVAIRA